MTRDAITVDSGETSRPAVSLDDQDRSEIEHVMALSAPAPPPPLPSRPPLSPAFLRAPLQSPKQIIADCSTLATSTIFQQGTGAGVLCNDDNDMTQDVGRTSAPLMSRASSLGSAMAPGSSRRPILPQRPSSLRTLESAPTTGLPPYGRPSVRSIDLDDDVISKSSPLPPGRRKVLNKSPTASPMPPQNSPLTPPALLRRSSQSPTTAPYLRRSSSSPLARVLETQARTPDGDEEISSSPQPPRSRKMLPKKSLLDQKQDGIENGEPRNHQADYPLFRVPISRPRRGLSLQETSPTPATSPFFTLAPPDHKRSASTNDVTYSTATFLDLSLSGKVDSDIASVGPTKPSREEAAVLDEVTHDIAKTQEEKDNINKYNSRMSFHRTTMQNSPLQSSLGAQPPFAKDAFEREVQRPTKSALQAAIAAKDLPTPAEIALGGLPSPIHVVDAQSTASCDISDMQTSTSSSSSSFAGSSSTSSFSSSNKGGKGKPQPKLPPPFRLLSESDHSSTTSCCLVDGEVTGVSNKSQPGPSSNADSDLQVSDTSSDSRSKAVDDEDQEENTVSGGITKHSSSSSPNRSGLGSNNSPDVGEEEKDQDEGEGDQRIESIIMVPSPFRHRSTLTTLDDKQDRDHGDDDTPSSFYRSRSGSDFSSVLKDMVNALAPEDFEMNRTTPSTGKKIPKYALRVDDQENYKATQLRLCTFARPHMRAFHFAWWSLFVSFWSWLAIAPLLPVVQDTMNLTHQEVWTSTIASMPLMTLFQIPMMNYCGIRGPRAAIILLLCLFSIPMACIGTVQTSTGLSVIRLLSGSFGTSFVMAQFWVDQMYAERVVGIASSLVGGCVGSGIIQIIMGSILFPLFKMQVFGGDADKAWRAVILIPPLVALVTGFAVCCFTDDTPLGNYSELQQADTTNKERRRATPTSSYRKTESTNVNTWILFVQYACIFGVFLIFSNGGPLYFHDEFGLSTESAAAIVSVFGFMNWIARYLGAKLSDFGNRKSGMKGRLWVHTLLMAGEGISCVLFANCKTLGSATAVMALVSILEHAAASSCMAIVPYIDPGHSGRIGGIVGAGAGIGGVWFGLGFRQLGYGSAFRVMGITVWACSVLSAFISIRGHARLLGGETVRLDEDGNIVSRRGEENDTIVRRRGDGDEATLISNSTNANTLDLPAGGAMAVDFTGAISRTPSRDATDPSKVDKLVFNQSAMCCEKSHQLYEVGIVYGAVENPKDLRSMLGRRTNSSDRCRECRGKMSYTSKKPGIVPSPEAPVYVCLECKKKFVCAACWRSHHTLVPSWANVISDLNRR